MRVAHLTSAHPRFDTRIFVKQCCSLAQIYDTYLIVADGKGSEIKNKVNILDVGKFNGRKNRILNAPNAVLKQALDLDAQIYHLHDPELIPIGLKLKKHGKKVLFDAHEDLPNQIMSKHYLNVFSKKVIAFLVKTYEKYACAKLDGIVTATPFIRDKFLNINKNTLDINNYPKLEEFSSISMDTLKGNQVCYIGGLADVRGIVEMVHAINLADSNTNLFLAGDFADKKLEQYVIEMEGWKKVNFLGYVGRDEIRKTLASSVAGLVVLHPTRSYLDSLPVKMFEYMCAGIPVIASDFPLWRSIIDNARCGICVDPLKPAAIAQAIDYFVNSPDEARLMGQQGRTAVLEKYNWSIEEKKLFNFYSSILDI
ncbi:glycosyltransferase family 4 protein [Acinetobacter sp. 1000160]|uniref:glycosyltransferase family 4 protein n=1 Tax=Acinetobacter sp. 1000160 TaxID=1310800 RepID=UPI00044A2F97|nr:glycosyltransferase family 4 protein [Acinetobacter sp. 1000160]EXB45643.1 glycosyl transferases group 1 family protein [Acinetobacter baumannii 146457]EYT16351.1 glycosyl transferases group 1 family protein [Acinetobacter sp. 1000160]